MGTHRLRNLLPETITEVDPGPNYTLGPRTPGGGTDPLWLRFLASETITKLGHGPNYSLGPNFNDAEILHGVIEEHVTCCYHHWTGGGGTDPVWLRFLPSENITKLGPAQNCSLDPTFNDAEILHGVIEEHMICWYYHWTKGGGTDPVWLRYLASETITKLGPGPNYSLNITINNAEIIHNMIEEHVTCWYHHWTKGGGTDPVWLRFLASETNHQTGSWPNLQDGPNF